MSAFRGLIVALSFCLSWPALSQAAAESDGQKCEPPAPGNDSGSCAALKVKDIAESRHVGDIWINCVTLSGEHGFGGQGMAMFLGQDASMYWIGEVDAHLAALEKLVPPGEFKKLKAEHARWEDALPAAEDRAYEAGEKEYPGGGSAAFYVGARKAMEISRQHALKLGCMIESRRKL